MYARIVTFKGATNIDGGIAFVRDQVVPLMRQQNGYRGLTASADRAGGVFGVLSTWETEADRDASDSALAKTREEASGVIGGQMQVGMFEQAVVELARPPALGSALLIRQISMDPSNVEDNLAFFKREVLPQIKAGRGFLAVRQLINRTTGEGLVGTVWEDADAMEEAARAADERRQQAAAQQVTFGEQSRREVVLIDQP